MAFPTLPSFVGASKPPGMPSAVPGGLDGLPPLPPPMAPSGGPPGLPPPPGPGAPPMMPGVGPDPGMDPGQLGDALPQYIAETQLDGTILLRLKNPDGTPGVAVKVLPGVKSKGFSG